LRQVLRQRQSKSNPLYSSSIGCLTLQHAWPIIVLLIKYDWEWGHPFNHAYM
jgi:hypothetical protein